MYFTLFSIITFKWPEPRSGPGRGRGRGRGANAIPVGGARKKIMSIREQRRKEDLENAFKMRQEMQKAKEQKHEGK